MVDAANANSSGSPAEALAVKAAPFIVIALAVMAVRTPLAANHPWAALLLFLWIVLDTMMLSLMARASGRPKWQAVLAVMAAASVTVSIGSPAALREVLWATPMLVRTMAVMVLGHLAWATVRAKRALAAADDGRARWIAAASEILPPKLVRLAATEMMVMHMALFRWRGPADVPSNCRAFAYHRHLAPMCTAILILSSIEIAVYHLLVGHWSLTAAIIMFILSDVGFIYVLGIIKSFRLRPVLLTPRGVHVRAGFLIDHFIPFEAIAGIETSFTSESVRHPATLNAALLAWPNIRLRLHEPTPRHSLLKGSRPFNSVMFRLDDPEPFVRLLLWRLGQKAIYSKEQGHLTRRIHLRKRRRAWNVADSSETK